MDAYLRHNYYLKRQKRGEDRSIECGMRAVVVPAVGEGHGHARAVGTLAEQLALTLSHHHHTLASAGGLQSFMQDTGKGDERGHRQAGRQAASGGRGINFIISTCADSDTGAPYGVM